MNVLDNEGGKKHKPESCGKFLFCRVARGACAASLIGKINEREGTQSSLSRTFHELSHAGKKTFIVVSIKTCIVFVYLPKIARV
jgi:hypothetical protein